MGDIQIESGETVRIKTELSNKEKEVLGKVLDGDMNPNTKTAQEFLRRPHVAIAFEAMLEKYNLSEDHLIKRLAAIVNRQPTVSVTEKGGKTTNITQVDANAKDTIRMIWQAQGKFVEKHEIKGEMHHVEDKELDNIINSGINFLAHRGKVRLNDDTPATGNN